MTRSEAIKRAADELFKGSEYPVPNTYSFIKGAEWADSNPEFAWKAMTDNEPEKGQVIILAVIDIKSKGAVYQLLRYDPYICLDIRPGMFWMPVPDFPESLLKPLFGTD
ncbi:MAG: hypothetical protein NC116_10415 [Clostridium sp.]|nr:hypothetical protein [Clostridium sp.]